MTSVHILGLGCAKNQVDSEVAAAQLRQAGATLVDEPAAADVILVYTCTFIEDASSESVDAILDLARHREQGGGRADVSWWPAAWPNGTATSCSS